jgi:recombination protein RecA
VVEKSGSWFSHDGDRIGQGREAAKTFLSTHPDVADKIEAAIRGNAGLISQNLALGGSQEEDEGDDE